MKTRFKQQNSLSRRLSAFALAVVMLVGIMPTMTFADSEIESQAVGGITTVSDPETLTRPADIYGQNTMNAGKVTVGKSVSDSSVTLTYGGNSQTFTPGDDNFIITISQAAQVMGLASESSVPVDAVFVLDTSGSMNENGVDRSSSMVTAANAAIKTLMEANENNRVAVVAFSSDGYGGGTSGDKAASVLSSLAHYSGDAATSHLQWVNHEGDASGRNRNYIAGRDTGTITTGNGWNQTTRQVNAFRDGHDGGTNIQAGIITGAKLLTAADTTAVVDGKTVTRMPFLIILSDGQPTFSYDDAKWYDPTLTGEDATGEQGPGRGSYVGNSFLPAITAAYYKSAITNRYFGANANEANRCSIYTVGVQINSLTGNNRALAQITLNPQDYFGPDSNNSYNDEFTSYWNSYTAGTRFNIQVDDNDTYRVTADSIAATKSYVKSLAYNDDYFAASSPEDLSAVFESVVASIQQKAISSPTHVGADQSANFSGYVTFTDPLGEYMEVKDMKGILAGGNWYQGAGFARRLEQGNDAEFNAMLRHVLAERLKMSNSNQNVDSLIAQALASENQAYYNSASDYDNSIVWWGNGFTAAGEEDEQVQHLGFADNDTIEYIEQARAAGTIPANADYVCRSYFFYGTAGDTVENPDHEYLHFVIRVQRSLTAPYQQTVVISAPASLLSVETVLITEDATGDTPTYTALVEPSEPARVVYEVGLRSDINAYSVESILAQNAAYLGETADGVPTNYDPATGEYTFYTNDWDRTQTADSHKRAMTHATFDAAADNAFYTYQEDTLIVDVNGNPYTGPTAPTGLHYYAREVYDWSGSRQNEDGTYNAVKRTVYIQVRMPEDASSAVIQKEDGLWYIVKGSYTASTLMVTGDDVLKSNNATGTSAVVAHPTRTGQHTNSHYTVYLGNNGKLTMTGADSKTVSITRPDQTVIQDADGKVVTVGDTLTYDITTFNGEDTRANATVTDVVPAGTDYVAGSATHGGVYDAATRTITWNLTNIAPGESVTVSFSAVVTEDALNLTGTASNIENAAVVRLSNGGGYTTNTTVNPPEGKTVVSVGGSALPEGGVMVPQVLEYHIQYHNDEATPSTVTITDIIPEGTTFVPNSITHGGVYDANAKTVTWTLNNVRPGASGVVSFRVNVNASAGQTVENDATIQIGDHDPRVTNNTAVEVQHGDLVLSKAVTVPQPADLYAAALGQAFTLNITEIGLGMNGAYGMTLNGEAVEGGITFTNGVASVTIKNGDEIRILGIPAGAIISVTEAAKSGYTPAYRYTTATGSAASSSAEGRVTIVAEGEVGVAVTNTYAPAAVPFTLHGTKVLDTNVSVADTVFGFIAHASDAEGNVAAGASFLTGEATVSSTDKTAAVVFSPVTFSAPGNYHYLISELNGRLTGVTYAENQYLLSVRVYDDGSGILKTEASLKQRTGSTGSFADAGAYSDSAITFVNTYKPLQTQLTLTATKKLEGRPLVDDDFSFVVVEGSDIVTSGTNEADGTITFRPITYTAAGVHTYTIYEVGGGLGGIKYDTTRYTVTVTVADVNGQLVATPTYPEGGVVFSNTYEADSTTFTPSAVKRLENRNMADNEFTFLVKSGENVVSTGWSKADGTVTFSAIGFETAGVYDYTITEVGGNQPGMTYSSEVYYLRVTVEDNGDGTMTATGKYYSDGAYTTEAAAVVFTNVYTPPNASVQLSASKTLTGRDMIAGEFSFVAMEGDSIIAAGGNAAAADGSAAAVTFSAIGYDLGDAGQTYVYTIKELPATQGGVTSDTTVYYAQVSVTNNAATGLLETAVKYYSDVNCTQEITAVAFRNEYDPTDAVLTLPAGKTLINKTLTEGEFTFCLKDSGGNIIQTVTNKADGTIPFAPLTFAAPGTYTYTVEEFNDGNPRYSYDASRFTVVVTVTDDNNGVLSAVATYHKGDPAVNLGGVEFINRYTPPALTTDLSVQIGATKTVDAPNGTTYSPEGFRFVVTDVLGNVVSEGVSVDGDGDGVADITFDPFTFSQAGEYRYWITEQDSDKGGITEDSRTWELHIRVRYNEDTGLLYIGNGDVQSYLTGRSAAEGAKPAFVNLYRPAPVDLIVTAGKELTGRDLNDGEFIFRMMDGTVIRAEGRNDAEGLVEFELSFTEAGIYAYTIQEYVPVDGLGGVTYDQTTVGTITITVTDDGSGKLKASVGGEALDDGAVVSAGVTFQNTYTAAPATATIYANKQLIGKSMQGGEFIFQLTDTEGNVVATATNDAAGDVVFTLSDLAEAGTYTYTMTEQAGSDPNVTYDDAAYTVTVTVTDDLMGQLQAEVSYGTENANAPTFENTYTATEIGVVLSGTKTLTGRKLVDGEFVFEVRDSSGALVSTGTNTASGTIDFEPIVLAEEGQYTFSVTEVNTGASRITYDTSVFTVTVDVTNEDGTLVAAITYPEGGIEFNNNFDKPDTPQTGDDFPIMLYMALMVVSGGTFMALILTQKKERARR